MGEHSDSNHLFPLMSKHSYWLQGTEQGMEDSSERQGSLVWCHWSQEGWRET